jgi:hypothetical protein
LFGANLGRPAAEPTVERQKLCRDFDVSKGGGDHSFSFAGKVCGLTAIYKKSERFRKI